MDTRKNKRIIARLSVFCAVFLLLALGYGFKYVRERDTARIYRITTGERAYASLCAYMNSMNHVLRSIKAENVAADNKNLIGLTAEYSALAGGAKAVVASLPFDKTGRERLHTFLTESDDYIRSFALSEAGEADMITEYILYTEKITEKLSKARGEDPAQIAQLQIDTPPYAFKEEAEGEYMSGDFNITAKQAKKTARGYLGEYITLFRAESDDGVYRYAGGSSFADILRSGGALIRLSSSRICTGDKIKLTQSEARHHAEKFLSDAGLHNLSAVSEIVWAGRYEAQYLPAGDSGGNRFIYIGVSLDTGKVTYFDASDYYKIK